VIQFPLRSPAAACHAAHAPLHYAQNLAGDLGPRVQRALHVVLLQLVLVAVVRVHHRLAVGVHREHHVGAQDAAQLAQEAEGVVEELLRGDVDHQHQLAHGELLGHVVGAVQAVPPALCVVAALVAVAVGVVVLAVLVIQRAEGDSEETFEVWSCDLNPLETKFELNGIQTRRRKHSLALPLQILAVEAVVKASGVVALRVALAVVEVAPALQRGRAVLPRAVEVERAVAVVPAARVVVAEHVAVLVVLRLLAQRDVAGRLHLGRRRDVVAEAALEAVVQDVAAEAVEVGGADAVVERRL